MGGIGFTEKHESSGLNHLERRQCVYMMKSIKKPSVFYIGSTMNLYARRVKHRNMMKNGIHPNTRVQKHANELGFKDFIFEILMDVSDSKHLLKIEQFCMDIFNPCLNVCKIAGSALGIKKSDATKRLHSIKSKGLVHSESTKQFLRESMLKRIKENGHPCLKANRKIVLT